jgi:hypothetical protein
VILAEETLDVVHGFSVLGSRLSALGSRRSKPRAEGRRLVTSFS